MRRRLLVVLGLASLLSVGAPHAAEATPMVGEVVFSGSGTVLPGLCVTGTPCAVNNPPPAVQTWSITAVPPNTGTCNAAAPTTFVAVGCRLSMGGTMTGSAPTLPPQCGLSNGSTQGGIADTLSGPLGIPVHPITMGWTATAGDLLLVHGDVQVHGVGHPYNGLVRMDPLRDTDCILTPAQMFNVEGVLNFTAA